MYSVSSVVSQTAIMKTVIIEDKQRIESIILHCDACFVGITDLEGNPYVVPMNFGYENGIIYLHSGPEGSKLEMLEHNNNVCITFSVGHKLVYQHEKVACSYSMRSESAMCQFCGLKSGALRSGTKPLAHLPTDFQCRTESAIRTFTRESVA